MTIRSWLLAFQVMGKADSGLMVISGEFCSENSSQIIIFNIIKFKRLILYSMFILIQKQIEVQLWRR